MLLATYKQDENVWYFRLRLNIVLERMSGIFERQWWPKLETKSPLKSIFESRFLRWTQWTVHTHSKKLLQQTLISVEKIKQTALIESKVNSVCIL